MFERLRGAAFALLLAVGIALLSASSALAQAATPPARFGILDNSFLIEEAFNQEAGVIQHIFTFTRAGRRMWEASFTEEWPLGSERHQLSATVPWSVVSSHGALGDVLVNYRMQLSSEGPRRAAVAPRLSLVLPTSAASSRAGLQFNLPVSKQAGGFYWHSNAGATVRRHTAAELFLAGSAIAALTPMVHLMLEGVVEWSKEPGESAVAARTLSPGIRAGWNLPAVQLVLGAAVPVRFDGRRTASLLLYLSFER